MIRGARVGAPNRDASPSFFDELAELPPWFYGLLAATTLVVVVLPSALPKYLVLGILALIFLLSYGTAPGRTIQLFIVLVVVVYSLPTALKILPGVNFDTVIVPSLALACWVSKGRQRQPPPPNALAAPATFYFLLLTISAIVSFATDSVQQHSYMKGGWFKPTAYAHFADLKDNVFYIFLAPIAFRLLWTRGQVRSTAYLVAWAASVVSLQAVWLLRDAIGSGQAGGAQRAQGLVFAQPNLFGAFLAMMVAMLVPILLGADLKTKERMVFGVALCCTVAGLLYSFSRGAWLAGLAGLLYLGYLRGARVVVFLLLLAMTAAYWIPDAVFERVNYTLRPQRMPATGAMELEPSAEVRLREWKALPGMWIKAPVFGHGHDSFRRVYGEITRGGRARAAESSIIRLLVEEGLVGLAAYCWLLWALARGARTLSRDSPDPFLRALSAGYLAALISLVVLDTSGAYFYRGPVMALIWLIGGALARMSWNLAHEGETAVRPKVTTVRRASVSPRGM